LYRCKQIDMSDRAKLVVMNRLLGGAISGAVATVPMTLTMVVLHRFIQRGKRRQLPPEQITVNLAGKAGIGEAVENEAERKAISLINHFGYGSATGAVYGLVEDGIDLHPVAKGIGYGLAVWAGSYLALLPAADILPPATRHRTSQNAMMIAAHIVWGAALGTVADRLRNGKRGLAGI
jgi:uncharacterized membrane protein YagU involved in acid resistance